MSQIRKPNQALSERLRHVHRKANPTLNAIRYSRIAVNPTKATEWLEGQVGNRNIVDAHVERLGRDMLAGRWQMNGETIKFNPEGILIDGQHRLWAVIHADVTIVFDIAEGVPNEAMLTIDTARVRQFSDHLKIKGRLYTTQVASAARWWFAYDRGTTSGLRVTGGTIRATHVELEEVLEHHSDLFECAQEVSISKASKIVPAGVLTFVYSGARKQNAAKATEWLSQLATGLNLAAHSPVYRLREKLMGMRRSRVRTSQEELGAIVMKSWLAFEADKKVQVLRWSPEEPFPFFGKKLRNR